MSSKGFRQIEIQAEILELTEETRISPQRHGDPSPAVGRNQKMELNRRQQREPRKTLN